MTKSEKKELLSKQFSAAQTAQETIRSSWTDRELISLAKLSNADKGNRKSRISEGSLSTIALERSGRIVAQLPSGKVRPASSMDEGNADIVNLVVERYILPNANDQYPLILKLFLIDFYADIYGGIDVLSYWRVDDDYVGPDCQILIPRNVFWQAGKTNKSQAEYVFVSTFVSKSWLEAKKEYKTWNSKEINEVLKQIDEEGAKPGARENSDRQTANDEAKNSTTSWGNTQEIELVTKYEKGKKGRWVSFLPDFDNAIVRDIQNPDESGHIPVFRKEPLLPLLDSIHGQGTIERGESLQKTIDSVIALTHDGLKYSLFPIMKYKGSMLSRSKMPRTPGAFWDVGADMDAVAPMNMGNQAMNTMLPSYQFLKGAMLNQNGTTDTKIASGEAGPDFGKTPQAIKKQGERESTFDRMSRDRFEAFYSDLIEHWIGMLASKQEKAIEFYIYDEEIDRIKGLGKTVDITENKNAKTRTVNGEEKTEQGSAKVTLKPNALKGKYRFILDSGSSMQQDDAEEHEKLGEIILTALKVGPEIINAELAKEGKQFSLANTLKRWVITGGAKDWDSIIQDAPDVDPSMVDPNMVDPMAQMGMPPQGMPPMQPPMGAPMPQPQMQPQMQPPMPQDIEYQPDEETLMAMQEIERIAQGG